MAFKTAEERREWQRKYNADNRERMNEYRRNWVAKKRANDPDYEQKLRRKDKEEVINHYGGKCACCGETRLEFLSIDHINGGGCAHRRLINNKGGVSFYRWLRKQGYPLGYLALCLNCNGALGFFGYCPHQRENTTNV
jgi:hypothetical protein